LVILTDTVPQRLAQSLSTGYAGRFKGKTGRSLLTQLLVDDGSVDSGTAIDSMISAEDSRAKLDVPCCKLPIAQLHRAVSEKQQLWHR
jgi:hypothetical protein